MAPRARARLRAVALASAVLLAVACSERDALPLRTAGGTRPNVLLITIDTLRADHLGAYGYALPTSPAFDALAAEGVRFANAFTPVPTTAPALASLVTGVHLDVHGVRENTGRLPETLTTIGEALAAAGYRTAGFYGNGAIQHGFGQGLETWAPFAPSYFFTDAVGTTRALAWIEEASSPWFLWIHYMDPHGPYTSSPPERTAGFAYPDDPALARELPVAPGNAALGMIPRYQALPGLRRVGDYVRRYDGEIAGTDAELLRLRQALDARGALDDTLIVVTADHGESLGENRYYFQHGRELNEASLRVPFVLRHRGLPHGATVEAPASLVDVLPTLLALVGVPAPAGLAGRDLSPLLFGATAPQRTFVAYNVAGPRRVAVRHGEWKLIGRVPLDAAGSRAARVLYRIDDGGGTETVVPVADEPEVAGRLEVDLVALAPRGASTRAVRPSAVTPADRERLRALGYID
jgi:arylsulfatase